MAIWMEMRCDIMRANGCYSTRNNGPMELAGSTRAEQLRIISMLESKARDTGWKMIRHPREKVQWACPLCKELV